MSFSVDRNWQHGHRLRWRITGGVCYLTNFPQMYYCQAILTFLKDMTRTDFYGKLQTPPSNFHLKVLQNDSKVMQRAMKRINMWRFTVVILLNIVGDRMRKRSIEEDLCTSPVVACSNRLSRFLPSCKFFHNCSFSESV